MGNVSMEASQINYRGGETKMSVEDALKSTSGEAAAIAQLQTDVGNLQTTKANQITIAPFFSAETAYDPGDLVYYNGLTYRCVNAHEGAWDADDFAATTISTELDTLKSGLTSKADYIYYDASSSASDDDALKDLFDGIGIYGKAVVGALNRSGYWMFLAFKYSDGNYGSIVAFRYDGVAKFLSVYEGTKTIRSFTFGS